MTLFALLLLAAPAQHVEMINEPFRIPPGRWYQASISLRQRRAVLVSADFRLAADSAPIRLGFLQREDLNRLLADRTSPFLALTNPGLSGRLRYIVRVPGTYMVFLDNRTGVMPATGFLRVDLDFAGPGSPPVTQLSRERQIAVIAISFAVFFAIAGYSARRLLRAIKN